MYKKIVAILLSMLLIASTCPSVMFSVLAESVEETVSAFEWTSAELIEYKDKKYTYGTEDTTDDKNYYIFAGENTDTAETASIVAALSEKFDCYYNHEVTYEKMTFGNTVYSEEQTDNFGYFKSLYLNNCLQRVVAKVNGHEVMRLITSLVPKNANGEAYVFQNFETTMQVRLNSGNETFLLGFRQEKPGKFVAGYYNIEQSQGFVAVTKTGITIAGGSDIFASRNTEAEGDMYNHTRIPFETELSTTAIAPVDVYVKAVGDQVTVKVSNSTTVFYDGTVTVPYIMPGHIAYGVGNYDGDLCNISLTHLDENGDPISLDTTTAAENPQTSTSEFAYTVYKGNATITGFRDESAVHSAIAIPESVDEYPVKTIAANAFYGNTALTSVYIPASVTSIGDNAFYGCTALEKVTLSDGLRSIGWYTFMGCTALTEIVVPSSVTQICYSAFYNCTALANITLYDGIATLANRAFENTAYFNNAANWNNGVLYIGKYLVKGNASLVSCTVKDGTVFICDAAFSGCTELSDVKIPEGVWKIGCLAFNGCTSLASVKLPDSILFIDTASFQGCTSLQSIVIPEKVKTLWAGAFKDCTALKTVTVPAGLTLIPASAFKGCKALVTVYYDGTSEQWEALVVESGNEPFTSAAVVFDTANAEDGLAYTLTNEKATVIGFAEGKAYAHLVIPNEIDGYPVVGIAANAFNNNTALKSVAVSAGVKSIGDSAFRGCTALETVTLSEGVTIIGWYAFMDCASLKSIDIPQSVTQICYSAFYNCVALENIVISDNLITLSNRAFQNTAYYNDVSNWENGILYIGKYLVKADSTITTSSIKCGTLFIADNAFYGCAELTDVTIPRTVNRIGYQAFKGCSSLGEVTIPRSVTFIDNGAFAGCTALTSVVIPDSVTTLWPNAFSGCTGLVTVALPYSVGTVSANTFANCTALTTVYFDGTSEQWEALTVEDGNELFTAATSKLVPQEFKIYSASLTLEDDIVANFKVEEAFLKSGIYTGMNVTVVMNGETTKVRKYTEQDGLCVFSYTDVMPHQMNDQMTIILKAQKYGDAVESESKNYSITTYGYNMIDKQWDTMKEELRSLLVNMLNYGSLTQAYMKYNTDNAADYGLDDIHKEYVKNEAPHVESKLKTDYKTVETPCGKFKGAGLNLKDSITLRFKVELSDIKGLRAHVHCGGYDWIIVSEKFEYIGDNCYYVYFNGLDATQLREDVYITVVDARMKAKSNTVRYSVESYVASKQNSSDTALVNMINAMMHYGDSAAAYAIAK